MTALYKAAVQGAKARTHDASDGATHTGTWSACDVPLCTKERRIADTRALVDRHDGLNIHPGLAADLRAALDGKPHGDGFGAGYGEPS